MQTSEARTFRTTFLSLCHGDTSTIDSRFNSSAWNTSVFLAADLIKAAKLSLIAFTIATLIQGATLFRNDLLKIHSTVNDCRIMAMAGNTGSTSGLVALKMSGREHDSSQKIHLGRIDVTKATPQIYSIDCQLPQEGDFCCAESRQNGNAILAVAAGRSVRVFESHRNQTTEFTIPDDIAGTAKAVAVNHSAIFVVTTDIEKKQDNIVAIDRESARQIWRRTKINASCVTLHEKSNQLICGTTHAEIFQLDCTTGTVLSHHRLPDTAVRHLKTSPDGRLLVCTDLKNRVRLYDLASMNELWTLQQPCGHHGMQPDFADDGDTIIVAYPGIRLTVAAIDTRSGRQLAQWSRHYVLPSLIKAISSRLIMIADCDGGVTLWDWKSQTSSRQVTPQLQFESHLFPATPVARWRT